jgi:hypothetical protein
MEGKASGFVFRLGGRSFCNNLRQLLINPVQEIVYFRVASGQATSIIEGEMT